MSFADVIGEFKNQVDLTILRRAPNTVLKGRKVDGAESMFSIEAVLVPVSGKRLIKATSAYHSQDLKEVFSQVELKIQDATTGEGDRFTVGNMEYTVVESDEWDAFGEKFWHAMAVAESL